MTQKFKVLNVIATIVMFTFVLAGCNINSANADSSETETTQTTETAVTTEETQNSSESTSETLTKEQAKEDIDYLYNSITDTHPLFVNKDNQVVKQFDEKYSDIKDSITEDMTAFDLYKKSTELIAVLHDGHTNIFYNGTKKFIDDKSELSQYGMPVKINGESIGDIFEKYKQHNSFEFDFFAEKCFKATGAFNDMDLKLADVDVSDGATYTFIVNGEEKDFHYNFIEYPQTYGDEENFVSYKIDKDNNVGILTLIECTYNTEYRDTVKKFFTEVNSDDIKNIVLDLRGNSGGYSDVTDYFLKFLDVDEYKIYNNFVRDGDKMTEMEHGITQNYKFDETYKGNIYVLTDEYTYSSAMLFAMILRDNNLCTIIGKPSGNSTHAYGTPKQFELPNSHLGFNVSTTEWTRIDDSKNGDPVMPDIEVDSDDAMTEAIKIINNLA